MALLSAPLTPSCPQRYSVVPSRHTDCLTSPSYTAGLKTCSFSFPYVLPSPATSHTRSNPLDLLLPVQKLQLTINYSARSILPAIWKSAVAGWAAAVQKASCREVVILHCYSRSLSCRKRGDCTARKCRPGACTGLSIKGQKLSCARAYCLTKWEYFSLLRHSQALTILPCAADLGWMWPGQPFFHHGRLSSSEAKVSLSKTT